MTVAAAPPFPGPFISFEGGEGAGKSTQIRRLTAELEAAGRPVLATREPGGSPAAEAIREVALHAPAPPSGATFGAVAETLLMLAARRIHLDETINPARARGLCVLCDRFHDSTEAYQRIAGELDAARFETLSSAVLKEAEKPILTIVLDLDPDIASARREARSKAADRFERRGPGFHDRVRAAFLEIAAREPERCAVVDAGRSEDAVAAEIAALVESRFGPAATS